MITAIPLLEAPGRPREADLRVEYFTVLGSVTAANIVGTLWTYEVIFYGHFAEGAEKFAADGIEGETRSASLREGFDGDSHGCYASVCRPPWPTLRSTNCFESMISVCREHAGNVKCWSAV